MYAQPQSVQHSEHIREWWQHYTVKCQHSRCIFYPYKINKLALCSLTSQHCCGILQGFCIAIKRKYPGILVTTPIPMWLALSIHCAERHGTCPRQPVPVSVWPQCACAKRLSHWVGHKHQGYNGAVVPAVAQGILYGGDLLASCHWVTWHSAHVH